MLYYQVDGRVRTPDAYVGAKILNVYMQEDILVCISEGLMNYLDTI